MVPSDEQTIMIYKSFKSDMQLTRLVLFCIYNSVELLLHDKYCYLYSLTPHYDQSS